MNFLFASSTKADGNMSEKFGTKEEVKRNREGFLAQHGATLADCVIANLAHDDTIQVISEKDKGKSVRADALVTNAPGVILFMLTADCFPVGYFDAVKNVVALAHLGWKPTDLRLAGKIVEKMKSEFGSNPADIHVSFGPGIYKDSYIVPNPQQKDIPEWQPFLEDTDGGVKVNLIGFNKRVLAESGVSESNIAVSETDTATSSAYFSHYRSMRLNEPEGRFATVVAL